MEPIECAGEVSADDWHRARRALHGCQSAFLWSGPVFVLCLGTYHMARRGEVRVWDLVGTLFGAALLASDRLIDAWAFRGWLRLRAGETCFRFAPFEFEMKTPHFRGPIRWSQLERVMEMKEYFVLGSAPCFWCVIPRRLMAADTESRWRELAGAEVATMGKRIEVQR